MINKIINIVITLFVFSGCANVDTNIHYKSKQQIASERRRSYVNQNSNLSEQIKQDILSGTVRIGMNTEMVILGWGKPNDIKRYGDYDGITEVWNYFYSEEEYPSGLFGLDVKTQMALYERYHANLRVTKLIFTNGVLTNFSEQ